MNYNIDRLITLLCHVQLQLDDHAYDAALVKLDDAIESLKDLRATIQAIQSHEQNRIGLNNDNPPYLAIFAL